MVRLGDIYKHTYDIGKYLYVTKITNKSFYGWNYLTLEEAMSQEEKARSNGDEYSTENGKGVNGNRSDLDLSVNYNPANKALEPEIPQVDIWAL